MLTQKGFVVAGVVSVVIIACYGSKKVTDGTWRVGFAIGLVFPLFVLALRLQFATSTQYKKHAITKNIPYAIGLRYYWKPMLGVAISWFLYDFVSYPFGLFSSVVTTQLNPNGDLLRNVGLGTAINCFYLPGCIAGGLLMDRIGRKQTMSLGFFVQAIFGFVLGGAFTQIRSVFPLFVVMYGIFLSLGEMGPGVATFLCGAESFPTTLRGHFIGFAAAVGKAGAAIGTQVFTPIQDSFSSTDKGIQAVFLIGSAFSMTGALVSWFLIPNRDRDLNSEDIKFRAYLAKHGYDTSEMGL